MLRPPSAARLAALPVTLLLACAGDDRGATESAASSTSASSTSSPSTATSDGATASTATTDEATGDSTGAPACASIVDSTDCAALAAVSPDLTLEACETCQGAACDADPRCDPYPCVDGAVVLRGCCSDRDCDGLAPFCGMYIATNDICVTSDDV